jgi:hypothetical protein
MVYCGKPSKGCGQCRTRKIRCDQARPACSQCTRARRECPGYRDELSLMFRDESKSVVRKAKAESSSVSPASSAAASRKRHASSRSPRTASPEQNYNASLSVADTEIEFDFNSDPQHQFLMQQLRQSPLMIQPTLEPSKEEAISYFLQSHAIPGTFMSASVANFLMRDSGSVSQKAMQSSLVAVASALLSRVRNVASLRQAARQEYGSALQLVNMALTDADEAKTNQALGAVILLSVYEVSLNFF